MIQQASLLGQTALGERAGKRARRVQVLGGQELALPPRCASFVVAANAAWRAEVVPSPPAESPEAAKARRAKRLTREPVGYRAPRVGYP